MQEKTQYIHGNEYTRPGIKNQGVKGVVWHYTASPGATARNIRDYFDGTCVRSKRYASAHDTIDNKEVINMIPHNEVAYHAHDHDRCLVSNLSPNANFTSIGVELCIDSHGNLEDATYQNAVLYGAELCREYGLDPLKDFYRHYDVTHKNCPAFWVSNPAGFERFKHDVANQLKGDDLTVGQYEELKKEIADLKQSITELSNNDAPADDYAKAPLAWAKEKHISTGERPQDLAKREEVVTIVKNHDDLLQEQLKSLCKCCKQED